MVTPECFTASFINVYFLGFIVAFPLSLNSALKLIVQAVVDVSMLLV